MSCLFCQIIEGKLPAEKVYEDETLVAIKDIHPAAPVHLLLIPRRHIATALDLEAGDADLIGKLYLTAVELARQRNLEAGFRIVHNCNEAGGQSVYHLHFHLLGGRQLGWPPG
ncbi:MAG: histidine triad nucleotide-binding protein [Deltaproteobacteria bacterium]|nr:MAG: histidine triad nucleotide-binding protein [Deltaproteobacteria bacterium]